MTKQPQDPHSEAPKLSRRGAALAAIGAGVAAALGTTATPAEAALATLDENLALPVKYLTRNGVRIAYVEKGSGDKSMLLVHGMLGSHHSMLHMVHHYAEKYRVVAIDMRGHGESDKPKTTYDMKAFSDDLVQVCRELRLNKPVCVGHSFGGSAVLHLAFHHPDAVGGIVMLDAGIRPAKERAAELKAVYDDPDPEALRKFLAERMLNPFDPPELKEQNAKRAYPPEHVVESMQQTVITYEAADDAASIKLPGLFILATRPFTDQATLKRLGPNWLVGQVVASGHSVHIIVPDQVYPMMDRFLAVNKLA